DELGQVYHYDLFGKRERKYEFLIENDIKAISFSKLESNPPNYFMVTKDMSLQNIYMQNIALNELFVINSLGLLTKKDKFITDFEIDSVRNRLLDFLNPELSDDVLSEKYNLKLKDNDKWNLFLAREHLKKEGINDFKFRIQNYRCFDTRYVYYDDKFVARLNTKVLGNFKEKSKNYSLISVRQLASNDFYHIFISDKISDQCFISNKTKEGCQVFPLYLYPETNGQLSTDEQQERIPNLNKEIVAEIAKGLGLIFTYEKEDKEGTFAPIDIL